MTLSYENWLNLATRTRLTKKDLGKQKSIFRRVLLSSRQETQLTVGSHNLRGADKSTTAAPVERPATNLDLWETD